MDEKTDEHKEFEALAVSMASVALCSPPIGINEEGRFDLGRFWGNAVSSETPVGISAGIISMLQDMGITLEAIMEVVSAIIALQGRMHEIRQTSVTSKAIN